MRQRVELQLSLFWRAGNSDVIQRLGNSKRTPKRSSMLWWVSATPGVSDPRHTGAVADQFISHFVQFEGEDVTLLDGGATVSGLDPHLSPTHQNEVTDRFEQVDCGRLTQ